MDVAPNLFGGKSRCCARWGGDTEAGDRTALGAVEPGLDELAAFCEFAVRVRPASRESSELLVRGAGPPDVARVLADVVGRRGTVGPGRVETLEACVRALDDTLIGGARLLKRKIAGHDAKTGEYLGRFEWALYHRHDRFAVPGPAQITYLQARPGKTIMVG